MWICNYCQTENWDDQNRQCVCCGKPRAGAAPGPDKTAIKRPEAGKAYQPKPEPKPEPRPKPKKSNVVLLLLVCAALLIVAYFNVHSWHPATCTSAETCSICGKTRGKALGHKAPKTIRCLEDSSCTRCGEVLTPAPGHEWEAATYDAPKTCVRCKEQEGEVKGYVGMLEGYWDDPIAVHQNNRTAPFRLYEPIENCRKLKMYMTVEESEGFPYGEWYLYARELDGDWYVLDKFELTKDAERGSVHKFEFEADEEICFDALMPTKKARNDYYSLTFDISFVDVQVY